MTDNIQRARAFYDRVLPQIEKPFVLQYKPEQKITDLHKFVDTHLTILEANKENYLTNGRHAFQPYFDRLAEVAKILKSNQSIS